MITAKLLFAKKTPAITILSDSRSGLLGFTTFDIPRSTSKWRRTAMYMAGSMGNVAFSSLKLVALNVLERTIWPVGFLLEFGTCFQINLELAYACQSAYQSDWGDFGLIRQQCGWSHLAIAFLALVAFVVGQYVLGIFIAMKFLRFMR
jgi:hypothetical protein